MITELRIRSCRACGHSWLGNMWWGDECPKCSSVMAVVKEKVANIPGLLIVWEEVEVK